MNEKENVRNEKDPTCGSEMEDELLRRRKR